MLKGLAFLFVAVVAFIAAQLLGLEVLVFLFLNLWGQAALHILYSLAWTILSGVMLVLSWVNWESSAKNQKPKGW